MVHCGYRGVTVFVCMTALYGSVIRLVSIAIVIKTALHCHSTATAYIVEASKLR